MDDEDDCGGLDSDGGSRSLMAAMAGAVFERWRLVFPNE